MRYIKKGVKVFFKVLLLLIIVPIIFHSGFLFVQSCMRTFSIYSACEPIEWPANDFMAQYGNRYFAFDLIHFYSREKEPYYHEAANHNTTFVKLYRRYPDMQDKYLSALVEEILDRETSNYNRIQMISLLERVTGIDFMDEGDNIDEYEDFKPYTQNAIRNIADWWSKHLQDNATAAIAATEIDYKFPPNPSLKSSNDNSEEDR